MTRALKLVLPVLLILGSARAAAGQPPADLKRLVDRRADTAGCDQSRVEFQRVVGAGITVTF